MPFVYIVRCADGSLYTGWAVDVLRRVKAHNAGKGARYTATHGPVELVYTEEVPTRGDALKRELAIKHYPRAKKLALCAPPPKTKRSRKATAPSQPTQPRKRPA